MKTLGHEILAYFQASYQAEHEHGVERSKHFGAFKSLQNFDVQKYVVLLIF